MADDEKLPEDSTQRQKPRSGADPFLAMLVKMIDEVDAVSIGITLNVGGILVSGELVSYKTYFNAVAEEVKEGSGTAAQEILEALSQTWAQYGERVTNFRKENPDVPPGRIHLKGTRFFHPSGSPMPNNRGVWWRGNLDAVEGFVMGTMSKA